MQNAATESRTGRSSLAVDRLSSALLVLGSLAGGLALLNGVLNEGPTGPYRWLDVFVGALGCVLLLARRRASVVVAVVLAALASVVATAGLANMVALYGVARRRRLRTALLVAAADVVAGVLFWWFYPGNDRLSLTLVVNGAIAAAAVAWGALRQAQQTLVDAYRERAERAEREQVLRAEQARSAERARIAREMHDAVAHQVSLIALHAGGLAVAPDPSTDQVRHGAELIRGAAIKALEDLRATLGVLREDEPRSLEQPGLDRLADLVEEARQAGQQVRLRLDRPVSTAVPDGLGRDAYRIVQEGLTNARKHAPGASVDVRVEADAHRLLVRVCNPLVANVPASAGGHRGLVGLHERVGLAGGSLRSGSAGAKEFVLLAELPLAPVQP